MKNILVPLDLSLTSDHVLKVASELARSANAKLWVIHVAAPDPDFVGFDVGPGSVRTMRAEELRSEHKDLQAKAKTLHDSGVACEALLVQGHTVETILKMGQKLNADVIVMGSHGHSALYRTFLGSVSEEILTDATIPVLIVPKKCK